MKKLLLLLIALALAAHAPVQAQSSNPLSDGARLNYQIIKSFITRAATKMPEENYGFRPTPKPDVRTFGQFVGHLADANYRMCSIVAGQDPPTEAGIERGKTTKADLTKALAESFTYCDGIYTAMTDMAGTTIVKFDAGGEGTRGPIQIPKLTSLAFHVQHGFEHYGNLVTYMRVKGIVPPSSELQPVRRLPTTTASAKGPFRDISGTWNLNVETPDGPVRAILQIKLDGEKVSIEADSERGPVTFTGMVSATEIKFAGLLQTLPMTFSGKPGPEAMTGTVDFGGRAIGTWSATRP